MQTTSAIPLRRTLVLAAVFGAGLVVGGLRSPLTARAQSGGPNGRATLTFVPVSEMRGSKEIREVCTDVSMVSARGPGRSGQEDGVIVLRERR
jgi:hypothetical protein